MRIPLEKRLRKRAHIRLGYLQDELVEILYSISGRFVLHGGTAIWRCHSGLRFSEDLDFYAEKLPGDFEERLREAMGARGLEIRKFKTTENLIFCKVASPEAEARIEINFSRKVKAIPVQFERMDGSSMIVLGLRLTDLILEKAAAYISRKLVRDVYDVYFLASKLGESEGSGMESSNLIGKHGQPRDESTAKAIKELSKLVEKFWQPRDEGTLKAIIFSGAIPTFGQMMEYLRGRFP